MRVAFVTDEVLPSTGADTIQFINALSALAARGVEVDLVLPVEPDATEPPEALRERLVAHYGATCGFRVVPVRAALTDLPRVFTKLAAGALGSARALARQPDLVHTRTLLPSLAALAVGRPLFFETYRPLTRQFAATRPVFRTLTRARAFGGLVVHSNVARDAFVADGVAPDRVATLYNGFTSSLLDRAVPAPAARAQLGWTEAPTLVYAGRLSLAKGLDLFIEAARRLPQTQLVFVGNAETDEARAVQAATVGLPNVRYTGFLSAQALDVAHQAADVLLIPPSRKPLEQDGTTVLPIKTFNYMAAGRAILAGDLVDARELLRDDDNAVLVAPDDVDALVAALGALLSDAPRRARLGASARAFAATLTWDHRAARLVEFYTRRLSEMR